MGWYIGTSIKVGRHTRIYFGRSMRKRRSASKARPRGPAMVSATRCARCGHLSVGKPLTCRRCGARMGAYYGRILRCVLVAIIALSVLAVLAQAL